MNRVKLFAEPFGCMMATGLGLIDGEDAHPAITVPGIKTGYRREILRLMGLKYGQGCETFLYGEANQDFVSLHQVLTTPALAAAVAEIFDRENLSLIDGSKTDPTRTPRALFDDWLKERAPINDPARWAARFLWLCGNSVKAQGTHWEGQSHAGAASKITLNRLAIRTRHYASVRWPTMLILHQRFERLHIGGDLSGCYFLLDPPYQGVTGYPFTCSLEDILVRARLLHQGGAVVAICETQPLANMLGSGWYSVEITGKRERQQRRWSATKHEYITINRPHPAE